MAIIKRTFPGSDVTPLSDNQIMSTMRDGIIKKVGDELIGNYSGSQVVFKPGSVVFKGRKVDIDSNYTLNITPPATGVEKGIIYLEYNIRALDDDTTVDIKYKQASTQPALVNDDILNGAEGIAQLLLYTYDIAPTGIVNNTFLDKRPFFNDMMRKDSVSLTLPVGTGSAPIPQFLEYSNCIIWNNANRTQVYKGPIPKYGTSIKGGGDSLLDTSVNAFRSVSCTLTVNATGVFAINDFAMVTTLAASSSIVIGNNTATAITRVDFY